MYGVPTNWEDSGRLSPLGDTPTDRTAENTAGGRELGIPTFGNGDGGSSLEGGGSICSLPTENICKVNRDKTHYGYISGGGPAP